MPILMPNGEYKSRKDLVRPKNINKKTKRPKPFKEYRGKNIQAMKHNRKITEEQAKYIIDMQQARRLRDMTRED